MAFWFCNLIMKECTSEELIAEELPSRVNSIMPVVLLLVVACRYVSGVMGNSPT